MSSPDMVAERQHGLTDIQAQHHHTNPQTDHNQLINKPSIHIISVAVFEAEDFTSIFVFLWCRGEFVWHQKQLGNGLLNRIDGLSSGASVLQKVFHVTTTNHLLHY